MSYYDIYKKRLNRFGNDYHSRIQGQREKEFDDYLLKSVYRVDFVYNDEVVAGSLEPYLQNESRDVAYLLLQVRCNIDPGTVVMLKNKDGIEQPWMIWWLENYKARGYNKYVVLNMNYNLLVGAEKQWVKVYGPGQKTVRDQSKSGSGNAIYNEDSNLYMMITKANPDFYKDQYFEFEPINRYGFRVVEIDSQTTKGIMYISLNPVYKNNLSPAPEKTEQDTDKDFYWLTGEGGN